MWQKIWVRDFKNNSYVSVKSNENSSEMCFPAAIAAKIVFSVQTKCGDRPNSQSQNLPKKLPFKLLLMAQKQIIKSQVLIDIHFHQGVQSGEELVVKMLRQDYLTTLRNSRRNLRTLRGSGMKILYIYLAIAMRQGMNMQSLVMEEEFLPRISRALCFEYMHNGSLQKHLYGNKILHITTLLSLYEL